MTLTEQVSDEVRIFASVLRVAEEDPRKARKLTTELQARGKLNDDDAKYLQELINGMQAQGETDAAA